MKFPFLFLKCCSLFNFVAFADTEKHSPIEMLTNVECLETSRIYESGELSLQTKAFNEILKSKTALEDFNRLFEISKTDAARLYALTALHLLDIEQYRKLSKTLEMDKSVLALWFDIKQIKSVRSWLTVIESGEMLTALKWSPSKRDGNGKNAKKETHERGQPEL